MMVKEAFLLLVSYFLIAVSSVRSQSISDEEIDSLIAQMHNDVQHRSYGSHSDFHASSYEAGPKNIAASFGFEKPAVDISAETSFAVPAPIAVPPSAPVVGVSAGTTFGIHKPVLGVSSGTSFGIQKPPITISPAGLLYGSSEILRLVEAFLKLKGELINHFLAICNDNWPLIRAVFNLIIGKIPKLQALALSLVSVLRKILEFAVHTFSEWNISLPGFSFGASGQTAFGVPHETYGVLSMQSIASFLEGYTRR